MSNFDDTLQKSGFSESAWNRIYYSIGKKVDKKNIIIQATE